MAMLGYHSRAARVSDSDSAEQTSPVCWRLAATLLRVKYCSPTCGILRRSRIRVVFDVGDEPAVVLVDGVEQPDIVEAEIKQDECASYLPVSG